MCVSGSVSYIVGCACVFTALRCVLAQRLSAILKKGGHGNVAWRAREITTTPPSVCVGDATSVLPHDAHF